jgi:hypothetical protein
VLALCGLATAKRSPTSEGTLAGLGVVELLDSRYRECRSHAVIVFAIREFESSRPSPPFLVYGDSCGVWKRARISGGLRAQMKFGDRRPGKTGGLGLFARAVSNADFRISEFRPALKGDRVLLSRRGRGNREKLLRSEAGETELTFLFFPGHRQLAGKSADGLIGWRATLSDGIEDTRRQISKWG